MTDFLQNRYFPFYSDFAKIAEYDKNTSRSVSTKITHFGEWEIEISDGFDNFIKIEILIVLNSESLLPLLPHTFVNHFNWADHDRTIRD